MPVGPDTVAAAADPLTSAVADAVRDLLRAGSELLSTGVYRLAPDAARDEVKQAVKDARFALRGQLRRALPVTAAAWLAGAQAHLADVRATGIDPDRHLDAPLQGLAAYTAGGTVTFDEAVAGMPDVDGDVKSAARELIVDLDQAFGAASEHFSQVMETAFLNGSVGDEAAGRAAAASVWNRMLDRDLTVPVASDRHMSIGAYSRGLTQTRLTETAMSGYFNRAAAAGVGFVAVSVSRRRCALCGPWEGRVLARSRAALARATDSVDAHVRRVEYTFADAVAGGLFHPYCRHEVTAWVEGVSVLPVPSSAADEGNGSGAQRVRDIERTVARWDRRAAFALTPAEQARARAKAAEWRNKLIDREHARPEPTPTPPPPVAAGPPMLAQPAHVLLDEGADPASLTATGLLRAHAQGAASEFTDHAARNPAGHRFVLTDLQAAPGHTGLRYRVTDNAGTEAGQVLISVVGPPRHPVVTATLVEAPDGTVRDLAAAFVTAWSGPDGPPALPRRNATPVTGPYLHDWPEDMSGLAVTDWVDNSTGINRSIEVTFADGSKGLYKPLRGDNSQQSMLGFQNDVASSSSMREVAAAAIDRALGLNLTPATRWWHGPEGPGSLQRWAEPSFPYLAPVKYPEVDRQRMAVFDYVLGNYDRHSGNYLTTHDGRPIAIDHGLSLRHANRMEAMFVAMAKRWWPLGKPIDVDLRDRLHTVDTGRLAQELAEIGLPADDIDAALARFEDVRLNGFIPSFDQL